MDTDATTAEKNALTSAKMQNMTSERMSKVVDTDAMTAAKMANLTSVTSEDSERMNDMDTAANDAMTAAKMQNSTHPDPEADAVIQQADERVGEPCPINALTF